jgi:predicted HAD superfamily hydrolase
MFDIDPGLCRKSRVVSFDLFDTLLLRRVDVSDDVFLLAGEKMRVVTGMNPAAFRKMRVRAERDVKAYHRLSGSGIVEPALSDIYALLCRRSRIPESAGAELARNEMETEQELIYVNNEVRQILDQCGQEGKRIIFASDMYLPFSFVAKLLRNFGLLDDDSRLYLSSAVNRTKRRKGHLFDHILAQERVAPDELLHIGDNPVCDVEIPARKGILTQQYRKHKPLGAALFGKSKRHSDRVAESLLSGISEKAMVSSRTIPPEQELNVLSCHISGPVLFSFVHWTMNKAAEDGIRTLYFLARDGEILLKIAREIRAALGLDMDLRYLFASRHSWVLPSILDFDAIADEKAFFKIAKSLSIERLLARFGINVPIHEDLLKRKLADHGLQAGAIITIANLARAKRLIQDREILDLIQREADSSFLPVKRYLEQEGILSGTAFGIVDVGWQGTLQHALRRLMIKSGGPAVRVTGYYFDVNAAPAHSEHDRFVSFMKDIGCEYRSRIRHELTVLLEIFTYATHGSTLAFVEKDGGVEPVFMEEDMGPLAQWGIKAQHETIVRCVRELLSCTWPSQIGRHRMYAAALNRFYEFLNSPNMALLQKIATFPYSVEQLIERETEYNRICTPFRIKDLMHLVKKRHVQRENDLWIQGSLKLTDHTVTRCVFGLLYAFVASRLFRRLEQSVRRRMKF